MTGKVFDYNIINSIYFTCRSLITSDIISVLASMTVPLSLVLIIYEISSRRVRGSFTRKLTSSMKFRGSSKSTRSDQKLFNSLPGLLSGDNTRQGNYLLRSQSISHKKKVPTIEQNSRKLIKNLRTERIFFLTLNVQTDGGFLLPLNVRRKS